MPRHASRWEVELTPDASSRYSDLMDQDLRARFRARGPDPAERGRLPDGDASEAAGELIARAAHLAARATDATARRQGARAACGRGGRDRPRGRCAPPRTLVSDLGPVWERHTEFDEVIAALEGIDIGLEDHGSSLEQLETVLRRPLEPDAKVLIFTEFRETQDMLAERLGDAGRRARLPRAAQRGSEGRRGRRRSATATGPQILISTEAGGEGRNFQFCHILVNYDLPWNPMKVEQRIGRLDRIGQTQAVQRLQLPREGDDRGADPRGARAPHQHLRGGRRRSTRSSARPRATSARRSSSPARSATRRSSGSASVSSGRSRRPRPPRTSSPTSSWTRRATPPRSPRRSRQEATPIKPDEFERLPAPAAALREHVDRRQGGDRRTADPLPPAVHHSTTPSWSRDEEARRVCFDPGVELDSEHVEYLGFGHPIVDRLVQAVIEERQKARRPCAGSPPSRRRAGRPDGSSTGVSRVDGLRAQEFVLPVFVSDGGQPIAEARRAPARRIAAGSRGESLAGVTAPRHARRRACARAQAAAFEMHAPRSSRQRASWQRSARRSRRNGRARCSTAESGRQGPCRVVSAHARRRCGASRHSPRHRAVVPLWEANLRRAEAEVAALTRRPRSAT